MLTKALKSFKVKDGLVWSRGKEHQLREYKRLSLHKEEKKSDRKKKKKELNILNKYFSHKIQVKP